MPSRKCRGDIGINFSSLCVVSMKLKMANNLLQRRFSCDTYSKYRKGKFTLLFLTYCISFLIYIYDYFCWNICCDTKKSCTFRGHFSFPKDVVGKIICLFTDLLVLCRLPWDHRDAYNYFITHYHSQNEKVKLLNSKD